MSLPNLRLQVLCIRFSACVLKFWLCKADWKDKARAEIIIQVWELCFLHVSQPWWSMNGQLRWHLKSRPGEVVGRGWQDCPDKQFVLCQESWKWTTSWRIILVSSEPMCSNLNYTTGWGRLETRSGNSVPCVPKCPRSVYLFWKTFQDSNCHRTLVFATWNTAGQLWVTLIFLPEAASATGLSSKTWEGDGHILLVAPVVPGSLCVTLASFVTILSSPRFSSVGSCHLLKIGFSYSVDRCIAWQHTWIEDGKKCKRRWAYVRNTNAPENTSHFTWASTPSYAPSSALIPPSFLAACCQNLVILRQKLSHSFSKLSQVCKGKLFIQECFPAGSKEQELICLCEGKRAVRYREDTTLLRS